MFSFSRNTQSCVCAIITILAGYLVYQEKQYTKSAEALQAEISTVDQDIRKIEDTLLLEKQACYEIERTKELIICFIAYDELDIKHIAEWITKMGTSCSIVIDTEMNHYNLLKLIEAIKSNKIAERTDIIFSGKFDASLACDIKQIALQNDIKVGDAWINTGISRRARNILIQADCIAYGYPDNLNEIVECGVDESLLAYMEYIEMTVNKEYSEAINGINRCIENGGTLALVFRPARGSYEGENIGIEEVIDLIRSIKSEYDITIGGMSEIRNRIENDVTQISKRLVDFSPREQELLTLIEKNQNEIDRLIHSFEFK